MSNNKQSSVEYFLYGIASLLGEFENKSLPQEKIMALFEQAKAMHKEEIKIAYMEGAFEKMRHFDGKEPMIPTEYYNETFGGNNEND